MTAIPMVPGVMNDTNSFYYRIREDGVVLLCFGHTVLSLSPAALLAVSETLKEVANRLFSVRHEEPDTNHTDSVFFDLPLFPR